MVDILKLLLEHLTGRLPHLEIGVSLLSWGGATFIAR